MTFDNYSSTTNNDLTNNFIFPSSAAANFITQSQTEGITGGSLTPPNYVSYANDVIDYQYTYRNNITDYTITSVSFKYDSSLVNPNSNERGVSIFIKGSSSNSFNFGISNEGKLEISAPNNNIFNNDALNLQDGNWYKFQVLTSFQGGGSNDHYIATLQIFDLGSDGLQNETMIGEISLDIYDVNMAQSPYLKVSLSASKWGGVKALDNFSFKGQIGDANLFNIQHQDYAALKEIYESTSGATWAQKWDLSSQLNSWYGITLENNRVVELRLSGNNLVGTIPAKIQELTELKVLHLFSNQLSGTIPEELFNLYKLTHLDIESNQLSGEVSPSIQGLSSIEELFLNNNQLTGNIPPELAGLQNLKVLGLNGNSLDGNIPTSLSSLNNLTYLALNQNQLTGVIPEELGRLTNLTKLYLSENFLTGEIPSELGSLTKLDLLYLWGNQLTGNIPVELGALVDLTSLSVSRNSLTGTIPSEL
ncbi:leucine-rich repeat domain-containing protein, partial [Tenacibaculum holothuriorum]